jgi:hypothetical protein
VTDSRGSRSLFEIPTDANRRLRLFFSLYFRMNEPLADKEIFCIDYLIETVGTETTVQPVVPHFQQSPLAADCATAETRIKGPPY